MQPYTYPEIIRKRRSLKIEGYKTLANVGFDGEWVTPYQISSCSNTGPVLVAYHWLDDGSIDEYRPILEKLGYLPQLRFNKVLDVALGQRGLTRSDIYMTQAFHLIPDARSANIPIAAINRSFCEVTIHELLGRKVIALGNAAAVVCQKHNILHVPTCHPSRRGHTNEQNALEIANALSQIGY